MEANKISAKLQWWKQPNYSTFGRAMSGLNIDEPKLSSMLTLRVELKERKCEIRWFKFCSSKLTITSFTRSDLGAARGGVERAQAPPLAITILMFIFLIFHQHWSRDGVHFRIPFGTTTRRRNTFVIKPGGYEFSSFEKYWSTFLADLRPYFKKVIQF